MKKVRFAIEIERMAEQAELSPNEEMVDVLYEDVMSNGSLVIRDLTYEHATVIWTDDAGAKTKLMPPASEVSDGQ